MEDHGDEALLAAARKNDRVALETLLRRYQPRIYRFGMRMCGNPHDAEDILQETLIAMARGVEGFRAASSLSTWLYTVARRVCIKKRRRRRGAPKQLQSLDELMANGDAQPADPHPGPEDSASGREIQAALARAIASLEPMYREVLVLRDVEGLPASDVAEVLDIGVRAVKSRLHRARVEVRKALLPHLGAETAASGRACSRCPEVLTLFSRHVEGEINPGVCAEMEKHVAGCRRCRFACDSLKQTLALCQASPTPRVPAAVQRQVRERLREALAV